MTLEQRHKDLDENTSTKALSNMKPQNENDPNQPEKPKSVQPPLYAHLTSIGDISKHVKGFVKPKCWDPFVV
jgi:hypothetical protein